MQGVLLPCRFFITGISEAQSRVRPGESQLTKAIKADKGAAMGGNGESDRSVGSDRSVRSGGLRPSGGYRDLRSFQAATIIYDATVSFCDRFLNKRSRTVDQMVQAARSGRQNIAEGSRASATSSQTELRLINVARASLDELLLDYEDYLRQHGKALWRKEAPEALSVRELGRKKLALDAYEPWLRNQLVQNAESRWCPAPPGREIAQVRVFGAARITPNAKARGNSKHRTDPSDPTDRSDLNQLKIEGRALIETCSRVNTRSKKERRPLVAAFPPTQPGYMKILDNAPLLFGQDLLQGRFLEFHRVAFPDNHPFFVEHEGLRNSLNCQLFQQGA